MEKYFHQFQYSSPFLFNCPHASIIGLISNFRLVRISFLVQLHHTIEFLKKVFVQMVEKFNGVHLAFWRACAP